LAGRSARGNQQRDRGCRPAQQRAEGSHGKIDGSPSEAEANPPGNMRCQNDKAGAAIADDHGSAASRGRQAPASRERMTNGMEAACVRRAAGPSESHRRPRRHERRQSAVSR
jgi:hypothetical protein